MKGISEEKKQLIRDLRKQKYTCKQVAAMVGVSAGTVTYITGRKERNQKEANIPADMLKEFDNLHRWYVKFRRRRPKCSLK